MRCILKLTTALGLGAIIALATVGSTTLQSFSFIEKWCVVSPLVYVIWHDLSEGLSVDQFDIGSEGHHRNIIPNWIPSWVNILTGYSMLLMLISVVGLSLPNSEAMKSSGLHIATNMVNLDIPLNILTSVAFFNVLVLYIPFILFLPWKIALLQSDAENILGKLGPLMRWLYILTSALIFGLAVSSVVFGITFL